MDEREELERFLKKGASSGAPSSSEKDDLEAFLAGGETRPRTAATAPTPTPRPKSTTPAYIPPTERQEFGTRPLNLDTSLRQSRQKNVGRLLTGEAALSRKSVSLRPDARPFSFDDADRRIKEIVADPAKFAALTSEQQQALQGTVDYERRNLQIPTRPKPAPGPVQGPPVFKPKRQSGTMPKVGALGPTTFEPADVERNILETALDPARASDYTADEWQALQDTTQRVVERDKQERFQGRISELVAERAAEKAAAPSYPEQLANRFMRGAVEAGASQLRGFTLLDPNVESDPQLQAFAPENVKDFTRRVLPVDPADEGLISEGVEAAGSAIPSLLGSAAGGAAGLPGRLAPMILGAASNAGQTYDEAIAAGQDPEAAKRAAIVGALIGLTEGVGVGSLGGRAPGILSAARRGALREVGMTAGKEFGEEWLQETFNQTLNNVNAKIASGYDPNRAISEGVFEAGLLGGLVGGTFGGGLGVAGAGAGRVGRLREMAAERAAGAEAVRAEPFAPLDLTPTTVGPTNLISLREAAKPEFRKRLDEATAPPTEIAPAARPPDQETAPPATAPAAPVENLTDLLGGSGRAIGENFQVALRESVEQSGKLPRAERGTLVDQVFETAVARGFPRDVATLDEALRLAGQGLEGAKAQFDQAFPAAGAAAPAVTPAAPAIPDDPVTKAVKELASLRRPTEADAKQAAEEAKKQAAQAGKEFEKQAKRAAKETEKEAKQAEKESARQARLDEQATLDAEGEIRRLRLYDESLSAAQAASEEAEALIQSGEFSNAIGKLRAQQSALGQSVKYLPETPEAVRARAEVATAIEEISARIPELRKQALAAKEGPAKPEAALKPARADSAQERRRNAEAGQRVADGYRAKAEQKKDQGDLLGAQADYLAELQALKGVMKLTSAGDVGRQTQIRNSITRVERDLRGVSGAIKQSEGKARLPKRTVDKNATTEDLPPTPLLSQVNNPEGGVPPRTEPLSGVFGRLARQQEAEREAAPQSRRKDTDVLSPVEYLKRATNGEGVRVSDRGEAALLGAKEAGIVGLTNRRSRFRLSDAQVILDEGGFMLDDGRRFTDSSVTENDVLQFLQESGKQGRLDTEGLDRRLAEEEAEFYANLPSESLEADPRITETAPLSERSIAPESAAAQPVQDATPARRPTERLFVPKATEQNIEELRDRRDVLSRLRYDQPGELTQDLRDEYRELGSRIAEFDNEQAKAARGGRPDLAPPPGGDGRPFASPSREDMHRAFVAAEARLAEETDRASKALPKSDAELLERGRAAVDRLFADIEQDVDALDLLERAIEGDTDAREGLIRYADRSHAIDADTVDAILDARRAGRGQQRGRIRQIAQARASESRTEAGAPGYGEDRETQPAGPQARELSAQDLEALNREPGEVADEDFDRHLKTLEALNNDRFRGLVDMPEWMTRQLEARIKQANEIRRGRVKEKRLGAKYAPRPARAKPLSKAEGGRRLVEQAKKRKEASRAAEKYKDEEKYHQIIPEVVRIAPNALRRMNAGEVESVSPEVATDMRFDEPIEVSLFADGEMRISDGHHRVAAAKQRGMASLSVILQAINARGKDIKSLIDESSKLVAEHEASQRANVNEAAKETPVVIHPNPEIDRKPILAETNRGTVLVANPNNTTGVSEVKDRSDSPVEHKFSSTQVNLPKPIADKILAFGRRIPEKDLAEKGRETEPHVTLKYGLHGWDSKFVEEALAGEGPVTIKFGKVSLFENDDADVVKIDIESPDLHRLNEKITESQPNTETHPEYKPHVTIAFVKKGKGRRYLGRNRLEGKTVTLDRVTFSGRDGERVEIPLGAKAAQAAKSSPALARAVGERPSDESKVKVADMGLESKTAPSRPANAVATQRRVPIDDITLGRDDLSRGRMNQVQTALAGGVKPEKRGVKLAEQVAAIEVVPDPERPGKWIVENDGNHRVALLKLQGFKGDVPVTAWEAPARSAGGGTYMGFGPGVFQPYFNRPAPPKTTPHRQIADALGHGALKIDAASIADEAIDALAAAVARGKAGSLPFARAVYWADKLKAKKVAGYLKNRQVQFITRATDLVQEVSKQSVAMDNAKRGSLAWEKAKRELDRARVKLSNHLARAGEYTHPAEYATKGYKASLLSALHIPGFNLLSQVSQFPFHEAQRAIDFLVPSKVFNKWGIPYDKAPVDVRTWAPAMARELGAIASGAKSSFGDVKDMLWYGVTETGLNVEAARRLTGAETEATDKYELGNRPRLIPGLDQSIMAVGRIQGAADVPLYNVVFATALAAEADATARKIARDNPQLKLTKAQVKDLARDLANDPSPAMLVAAADEADRFKLDYPTWAYNALQAVRNLPVEKFAGRDVDAVYKAALGVLIPFSKIPLAAVDTALFRYSPAGMVRVASRLREARAAKARGEEFTGRYKTAEQFGRDTAELYRQSIVGTLAWTALGLLGTMGYIAFTGGGDDDKRQGAGAVREARGERFTPEMVVGDTAVDLGKLGPVGQATSMISRISAAGRRRYETEAQDLEGQDKRALRVFGAAKKGLLLDNPIGRALTDVTEESGEDDFIRNKARGVVPGLLRDVARMTDDTKRMADQGDLLGSIKGDIRSGIPGLRKRMQPRLDVLGRPVEELNPFSVLRSLRPDAQLEDLQRLDVGLSKPQREQGESAADYNARVRNRGEQFQETLRGIREDDDLREASPDARRSVYAGSLRPQAMERAGKLSDGSVRVERQIEGLRAEAYAALRSIPEYGRLSAKDQKAVRDLINEELERFKATTSGVSSRGKFRREKRARVPNWTPADLAKAAMEARE